MALPAAAMVSSYGQMMPEFGTYSARLTCRERPGSIRRASSPETTRTQEMPLTWLRAYSASIIASSSGVPKAQTKEPLFLCGTFNARAASYKSGTPSAFSLAFNVPGSGS